MAVVTVSGQPGCRTREVAQLAAQRLGFTHVSAERLDALLVEEFGPILETRSQVWPDMAASILLRLAAEEHLVVGVDGAEQMFRGFPALLRVRVVAPANRRIGNIMLDGGLSRAEAKAEMAARDREAGEVRRMRFGRAGAPPESFDLMLNAEAQDGALMAAVVESAVRNKQTDQHGLLSKAAELQLQFQIRLRLAKHGIHSQGRAALRKTQFGHPSEETFANLLDFYRIAWEYEPRSFPIAWDESGRVLESFTPDFYLPEPNLYVELTTMKQSLVTRKNRKIRLLREIYPQVNIQVFYQKDLQDLVLKYGLVTES
ncbi:MAG: cytidylate kinase family protein [Acidobacteria bacterium]|nr:cytidylate kinase family protein [Acidobacteriota bacterium]